MKTLEQIDVICPEDRELLSEVKRVIQELLPGARVLLYGSVARGTQQPDSDYDILVLTNQTVALEEQGTIRHAMLDLELSWEVVFSTIFRTEREWNLPPIYGSPFRHNVERDGVFL